MSEPAQTTLTLHSSLAAFVLLLIAALLCSALLALHAACVRRVRACAHASLVCVRAAMSRSAPRSLACLSICLSVCCHHVGRYILRRSYMQLRSYSSLATVKNSWQTRIPFWRGLTVFAPRDMPHLRTRCSEMDNEFSKVLQ